MRAVMVRTSSHLSLSTAIMPSPSALLKPSSTIPLLTKLSPPLNPRSFRYSSLRFLNKTLRPLSPHFSTASLHRSLPMLGGRQLKASYSSDSGATNSAESREILVQHLLVKGDDLKLLVELQKKTAEGIDLSDLAVEYSICPSKEEGGMLGWVKKGQMVPEFEEAAFGAPLNKVVKCKTQFGWHLLQVLSEREEVSLQEIQPNELQEKMHDPGFLDEAQLIDVREPDEVAQASLPGFQVLPLRQFGTWGPDIMTKFDPEKETYVMCHHGMRSLQVSKWLLSQGFKRVFNVSGGIHAYAVKADPSVPTY